VVSDKKIFKISANENTLWTLAAMLDFNSAPKTQIVDVKDGLMNKCVDCHQENEIWIREEHVKTNRVDTN
jgi:predicted carbohydrate-binding protein with CBM5 and CBM33 domain